MTRPLDAGESRALSVLTDLAARPQPDDRLSRAAGLMPQLLALLRQADLPLLAIARHVGRDPVLVAEVLRRARAAHFGAQAQPVADLADAIRRIGEAGLQSAIARVVLLPIYETRPGGLSARATHAQAHAERMAEAAATVAAQAHQSSFDGYLAGLLYGMGWIVGLRAVDREGVDIGWPPSEEFVVRFDLGAHRLFGQAAQRWPITPAFQALAAEAAACDLQDARLPLAGVLREALLLAEANASAPSSP